MRLDRHVQKHGQPIRKKRQPDISLARNMLGGWEPKIQLRDGLLKTIAYFEEVLSRGGIRR